MKAFFTIPRIGFIVIVINLSISGWWLNEMLDVARTENVSEKMIKPN